MLESIVNKLTSEQINRCKEYGVLRYRRQMEEDNLATATYACTLVGYLQTLVDNGQISRGDKLKLYLYFTGENFLQKYIKNT